MWSNFVDLAANIYSGKREEARDHARVHNSYIEQVCSVRYLEASQYERIKYISYKVCTFSS